MRNIHVTVDGEDHRVDIRVPRVVYFGICSALAGGLLCLLAGCTAMPIPGLGAIGVGGSVASQALDTLIVHSVARSMQSRPGPDAPSSTPSLPPAAILDNLEPGPELSEEPSGLIGRFWK